VSDDRRAQIHNYPKSAGSAAASWSILEHSASCDTSELPANRLIPRTQKQKGNHESNESDEWEDEEKAL
jgi:hypothetical protein